LVARNLLKYILLLFIVLVLRHIALLVASLVVARNWSIACAWSAYRLEKKLPSNYVHTTSFEITFFGYSQSRNILEPNNLKVFGNKKKQKQKTNGGPKWVKSSFD
jgi:hypothetical protein